MRYLFVLCLICVGCIGSPTAPAPAPAPAPVPVPPVPSVFKASVPDTLLATIHSVLGDANAIRIENSLAINADSVKIAISSGCRVSYTTTPTNAVFTFSTPKPVISYGVLHPVLEQIELISDTTAVATVREANLITKKVKFTYNAGTVAFAADLPTLYAWSSPNCVPCATAKLAFESAKDLPFKVVWDPPGIPNPYSTTPSFVWSDKQNIPDKEMKYNWKIQGWPGLTKLLLHFNDSRKPRVQSAAPVASWHSHQCPKCGTIWSHPDNSATASHKCPKLGCNGWQWEQMAKK